MGASSANRGLLAAAALALTAALAVVYALWASPPTWASPVLITALRRRASGGSLAPPAAAPESTSSACGQALGLPKVALLFLSKEELFHEDTWRQWFQSAEGLVPVHSARKAACAEGAQVWEAAQAACGEGGARGDAISRQHLFSVYVHAPPQFKGYPKSAMWAPYMISKRVRTGWGEWGLVQAEINLISAAFKDPLNERFVLLSESGIPLYDPLTLYAQLLWEKKSRVYACPGHDMSLWRWRPVMEGAGVPASIWRKSSQFFTLTRGHAEVVAADTQIMAAFKTHCRKFWDRSKKQRVECYSDEHYLPTLLASKGLENETECGSWPGGPTAADWVRSVNDHASPHSYENKEIVPELIKQLRGTEDACNGSASHAAAQRLFVRKDTILNELKPEAACTTLTDMRASYDAALKPTCLVLARKFPKATAAAVSQLFGRAPAGTGLLARVDSD